MTDKQTIAQRLRAACASVRTKSYPLSDLIPLMQEAADALTAPAQPAEPHPPTRHCMCAECAPSFTDAQPAEGGAYAPYKQALWSKNCMQCCVSYMLGLPLNSVPDFATDGGWELFSEFVDSKGYAAVMLPGNHEFEADYLASGTTARGTSHMVVMNDGKLVHDPHPSNSGLLEVQCVWLLAKRASPTSGQQDEHAAFEASAKAYTSNVSFARDGDDYDDMTASLLWHGWKLRASHGQAPAGAAPVVAWYTDWHPDGRKYAAAPHGFNELGVVLNDPDLIREVWHPLVEPTPTAQPAPAATPQADSQPSSFGSPELQAMILARCVEKDQADSVTAPAAGAVAGPGFVRCSYGDGGYACCEGGPCQADLHNEQIAAAPTSAAQPAVQQGDADVEGAIKSAFFRFFGAGAERYWHTEPGGWFIEGYRAAHPAAPADSVLEDAARYRWLREHKALNNTHCWHFQGGPIIPGLLTLDAAIDAARKQGANHD